MPTMIKEQLEVMPNKQFALECFKLLINSKKLTQMMISNLLDGRWCQANFNQTRCGAILKEIPVGISDKQKKTAQLDGTAQYRFYPDIIKVNGRWFLITNYWYGPGTKMPNNRTPFMMWVLKQIGILNEV